MLSGYIQYNTSYVLISFAAKAMFTLIMLMLMDNDSFVRIMDILVLLVHREIHKLISV